MIIQDPKTLKRRLPDGTKLDDLCWQLGDFLYNSLKEQYNDYPKFWDFRNVANYQIEESKLFRFCYAYAMQLLTNNLELGRHISRMNLAKMLTSWLKEDITWYKKKVQDSIDIVEMMIEYASQKGDGYAYTTSELFHDCFGVYSTKDVPYYHLNSDDPRLKDRIVCISTLYDVISNDKRVEFCKGEFQGCAGVPENVSSFKIKSI